MTHAALIAHAAFLPERAATLARLLAQVPGATVLRSESPEHASTWAARLYAAGLDTGADFVTLLNDDVTVCPDFSEVVQAMHYVTKAPLALHTTHPMAEGMLRAGLRWFASYWLTGPAYSFSREDLRSLVEYRARAPRWFLESRNEDNVAMSWMWSRKTPAWHPLPAIAKHDTSVPSSLGYDKHPLRTATLTWEKFAPRELTAPGFWFERHTPLLVECPWMGSDALGVLERMTACAR